MARLVWGIHLGPPGDTFALARQGRPAALRSKEHVEGIPGLSSAEQVRVDDANTLLQFSVGILLLCRRMGLPATLEHPQTSSVFTMPNMTYVLSFADCDSVIVHYCMFGAPWRRATRIIGFNIKLDPLGAFQCKHAIRGLCQRSGLRHVALSGRAPGDPQFCHSSAQPYPRKLCAQLARCFYNTVASRIAAFFTKRLQNTD